MKFPRELRKRKYIWFIWVSIGTREISDRWLTCIASPAPDTAKLQAQANWPRLRKEEGGKKQKKAPRTRINESLV